MGPTSKMSSLQPIEQFESLKTGQRLTRPEPGQVGVRLRRSGQKLSGRHLEVNPVVWRADLTVLLTLMRSASHQPARTQATAWQDLPKTRLPNGLNIRYVSRRDVAFLYREVYEEQGYLKGLSLKRGDTVLDVGANIGLFALRAAETVGPEVKPQACLSSQIFLSLSSWHNILISCLLAMAMMHRKYMAVSQCRVVKGRVVCMEPIPNAAAALQHNILSHRDWCSAQGRPAKARQSAGFYAALCLAGQAEEGSSRTMLIASYGSCAQCLS